MRTPFRVVDFIVDFLSRQEVRHVFGVGGANIEDLYDALHLAAHGPLGVVAKHEFSAATMADGYHRAAQRMPVVAATSGAGAMNLVPGLAELRASCVPALALIGQPPVSLNGRGSFQETSGLAGSMDAARLFGQIAVSCERVEEPEAILQALPRAFAAASAAPGPAVLLLPKDVQQAVLAPWDSPVRQAAPERPSSAAADRARAVTLLRSAAERQGVAVIAGEGVARADARPELAALAAALGARVAVAPDAKDVFDDRDPRHLGIAGVIGSGQVQSALEQASAVLLAGTRLPQMAGAGLHDHLKGVPVVCLDPRPPFLEPHEDLVRLTGDLREEMRLLTGELLAPGAGLQQRNGAARALVDNLAAQQASAPSAELPHVPDSAALDMTTAARLVGAALPERSTVVSDAGNTGAVTIHHVGVPPGGRFIVAMGMGGMGHSFGAAVGAAFATGRRTCVLAGDGAFFMHGMEVHTAIEHRLPVTFVIFDNRSHGMCRTREQLFYGGDYSYNLFRPARIGDGMAAMFPGLDAVTARSAGELRAALGRAHATRAPALICVETDPAEVPPFRPFQDAIAAGSHRPLNQGVVPG
ncbi:thiamine pyrophosphate-binding protein [Streptomyces diacarni]|uniref:Thiamine pyrophosphate-binding protein n=1 Tax=Streptomyces diacarni TaxID=2800381 RepID=A0A367EQU9_9ACTN|nr:thiamine pyrophosphate-dependent enzyme [Streptomyces diacarni]RCG19767.1 thiamine pyrophosphate-binding protein [Streptomyces diacarni]